ncbi:ArsR family transcriptional regulator [Candidatus Thorarchaeota archaeon]|nr:MAG: ArsR family transcriptional regulator [Candidatus Thorarchaeota archaeon]
MTQRLTGKYLTLLIALQEGPMDRIEQIAERVGLSRTTVSRDLKWLSGKLVESTRRYFRVVPDLNEPALGLETIDVFLDTSDFNTLRTLEKMCDVHPYTKYRARCFGHHFGLFVQFRIPIGTKTLITVLLKEIKSRNLISNYSILPTTEVEPIFSVSRLQHWNSESFSWDFDWNSWASKKIRKKLVESTQQKQLVTQLDKQDISILTHLSYGARRKQKEIIEALAKDNIHLSSQDFSRRLAYLNNYFIKDYIVFLDTDAFDLYSNVILTARTEPGFSEEIISLMNLNPIPFRSTLKIKDDFLLWFLRLPPNHLSEFLTYLQPRVRELNVSLLDHQKSTTYGVWDGAFDNGWKRDRKFLVNDVLETL